MKHVYLVIFSLLIQVGAYSQNYLFIPFGQSEDEVKDFLSTRDYISEVVENQEMSSLRANLEKGKHVEYVFENHKLYATSVTRYYSDRKSAKSVEKKCLEYMVIAGSKNIKQTHNDNITCHTVVTDNRVIKLFVIEHPKSRTLTFTSVSRKYGPYISKKDYYYEIDLFDENTGAQP